MTGAVLSPEEHPAEERQSLVNEQQAQEAIGQTVFGADRAKIGTISQIYVDDDTRLPEWVTVQTGLFATQETFVPIEQARFDGEGLHVPYDEAVVKDAPRFEAEGHLSEEQEAELCRHYGMAYGRSQPPAGVPHQRGAGYDASGPYGR